MKTNKSLIVREKNFFTNIISFFKGLFKTKKIEDNETEEIAEKDDTRENFLNSIREEQDNPKTVKLQQAFENNDISAEDMSYEQILSLNKLYKKQITKIDEDLNMKKIHINILQKKMANVQGIYKLKKQDGL